MPLRQAVKEETDTDMCTRLESIAQGEEKRCCHPIGRQFRQPPNRDSHPTTNSLNDNEPEDRNQARTAHRSSCNVDKVEAATDRAAGA